MKWNDNANCLKNEHLQFDVFFLSRPHSWYVTRLKAIDEQVWSARYNRGPKIWEMGHFYTAKKISFVSIEKEEEDDDDLLRLPNTSIKQIGSKYFCWNSLKLRFSESSDTMKVEKERAADDGAIV